MNLDELRAWISANFWKSAQITAWAERTFYRRKVHKQTRTGTGDSGQPIILNASGYVDPSFYDLSSSIHDATNKATLATADEFIIVDSADTYSIKHVLFSVIRDTVKSYYDSVVATLTNKSIDASANTLTNIGTSALSNDAVSNAKLANMTQATIKGRASGTGTGDPTDLTAAQVVSMLSGTITAGDIDAPTDADGIFGNSGGTYTFPTKVFANGGLEAVSVSRLNLATATATISSGAISASSPYMVVDTEGGAGTDDLDTINGGSTGDIVVVRAASSSRTVVIKDSTGNINTPSDRSLTHSHDMWMGMYNGVFWVEMTFADNSS